MHDLPLRGLDGSNPLAFLAALGVLNVVSDQSPDARLRWQYEGTWRPVLVSGYASIGALVATLDEDQQDCISDAALALAYDGKRDLKSPPMRFRDYLLALSTEAEARKRRSIDWASSFATDIAVDNNGNIKPTALHFTAGQQQFLQMANELVEQVTKDDLLGAIDGPWTYSRPLPVMGWDATSSRDYALRASNPSTDKKMGVPGADWLALRGLASYPTVPRGSRVLTTGCGGGWKDGWFCWPVWTVALHRSVVRTLVAQDLVTIPKTERQARGVGEVFRSDIRRSDQGGYGSFGPASVI